MSADNRPALRETLKGYCEHVPPRINSGSYDLALKFKADVRLANKVLKRSNASEAELNSAINKLHWYWL